MGRAMKTTAERRKKWLGWISTGTLNWHLSRISLDYLSPEGVIKALIADIEELEARLAEYEAIATLDPVIECPSCGLEISLAEEEQDNG